MRLVAGTAEHLIALLDRRAELTLPRRRYSALLAQVALSETYAVLAADGRPVAIAGIAPLPGSAGEVWFGALREGLGADLLQVVRLTRDVLAARGGSYPGGIMCLVSDDNPRGQRLARLVGCVPQPFFLNGRREWTWASSARPSEVTTAC